jgi:hypothetical protein
VSQIKSASARFLRTRPSETDAAFAFNFSIHLQYKAAEGSRFPRIFLCRARRIGQFARWFIA